MSALSKVHLDTSALVDLCFWDRESEQKVLNVIPANHEIVVTRYVVFELARGFLRNLILVHNKSYDLPRMSDLWGFVGRLQRQPHYQGTVIGALQIYRRSVMTTLRVTDQQDLLLFRADLKLRIRRGWRRSNKYNPSAINPTSCRAHLDNPKEVESGKFEMKLPNKECGQTSNCGLRRYAISNDLDFRKISNALRKKQLDSESVNRADAIDRLVVAPDADFDHGDCYSAADAIIVHESLGSAALITKNSKHQGPIGDEIRQVVLDCN